MNEYTFTKDDAVKLGDVLGWCFNDFDKDPQSLNNKINIDAFQGSFRGWDGSMIIPLMNIFQRSTICF